MDDEEGKLQQDANKVRRRWKDDVEDLYQSKDRPTEIMEDPYMGDGEDLGPKLLREEVLAAINELKNNKAEGIDSIPAEILKGLGEKAMNELVRLCQEIYDTGIWPEDFLQSIMIPMKKKQNATKCEDYRTISLLTHASKILLKIIAKRVQAKAEADKCLGEDQFGFRKGTGKRDAIGALRVLTERSLEHNQKICIYMFRRL